jgi:hypothetical protein
MPRLPPASKLQLAITLAICGACATPPPPTAAARRLAQNPRAIIEGRVTNVAGSPAAGVLVQAVPGGKDIVWSAAAPTDAEGRFRLLLDAPADYVFLIFEDSVAAVTPSPLDPAQVRVSVKPGETKRGIELKLLREQREKLIHPLAQSTP